MKDITGLAISAFLGSGIGGVCRLLISLYIERRIASCASAAGQALFPWPTLFVNIAGCFLLGAFWGFFARFAPSASVKALFTVGFCGGLTTFSTFALENLSLLESGRWVVAATYIASSLIFGLIAAYVGRALIQCLYP